MKRACDAVLGTVGALLVAGGAAACRAPDRPAATTTLAVEVVHGGRRESLAAESSRPVCSRGLTGMGSWAVQYTDASAGSGLASLQVVAPEGAERPDGTDALYLGLALGASSDSVHVVETRPGAGHPQGTGHVEVRGGPDTAVVVVRGRAGSGAELRTTVRCAQVRDGLAAAR